MVRFGDMPSARVLLVDDDQATLKILAAQLETRGYQVRTRGSGIGIALNVRGDRPDLVVLDVNLPGVEGDEIAKQLRDEPCAVVLYSGATHVELERRALASGADLWLHKTTSLESVADAIDRFWQRRTL